ncbi:MAG: glycosyl hydrolase 115 family protein, partial [Ignavibacteriae bacterium]|nr:glycosyl hydrolase 115 family protein [Ignavibacteriota bacterium]
MKSLLIFFLLFPQLLLSQIQITNHVKSDTEYFPIVQKKSAVNIYIDENDLTLVQKSASLLANDLDRVSGIKPNLISGGDQLNGNLIIVGSIGKNNLIDKLIAENKLDVSSITDKWERFIIQTIEKPFANVPQALVIVGSDRRGTAYGVFTFSKNIGVSPWYYWADVPIKKNKELYIKKGRFLSNPPSVKYRGIFLNDEDWGLHPWASKNLDPKLNDIGPNTYEKIFELVLRLKGNMLAPAMHECTKAFFTVPGNMEMANNYGIIISTAHCEPLLYNNASEWDKKKQGEWNYATNKEEIIRVLDNRVKQACNNDNIYTIALRGMHDEGMKADSEEQKFKLLAEAVKDQRAILSKHIDKPLTEVPQIFVPYKEVLSIYEQGLDLPEDITIVWPDDNYGYIKKLSDKKEQKRKGGSGIYYHISYLGWPNDYLWLNTTPPALMYEELNKAYSLGADKYWLVNVGDIKPGELGMQLFLDMAWNIDEFNFENINQYQVKLLTDIFGNQYTTDISYILNRYYYHGFTRKPEYMTWDFRWNSLFSRDSIKDTDFSFANYNEAEKRLRDYNSISKKAKTILESLPIEYQPSFFELVYYPVKGSSLYNHEMLIAQKNRWYADQQRSLTNSLAIDVKNYKDSLALLTQHYNSLLSGKWNGMMTAPGFLPEEQLPPTKQIELPNTSEIGIYVEGQKSDMIDQLQIPQFSKYFQSSYFFEIYNKGRKPFTWKAELSDDWIRLSSTNGEIITQERINVSIDWNSVPTGQSVNGEILITSGKINEKLIVSVFNPESPTIRELSNLFVENNGVISISPADFNRKNENGSIHFQVIEGLGYSNSSLQLGHAKFDDGAESNVDYDFYSFSSGSATIFIYSLPIFAKDKEHSIRYGIQLDELDYITQSNDVEEYSMNWANNVIRNSAIDTVKVFLDKPGRHTLKLFCEDPGKKKKKVIIDLG